MKLRISGFEGSFAICIKESGKTICINRGRLPNKVKEGDVINIKGGNVCIDVLETHKRRLSSWLELISVTETLASASEIVNTRVTGLIY